MIRQSRRKPGFSFTARFGRMARLFALQKRG
jgi:hypothetical protein